MQTVFDSRNKPDRIPYLVFIAQTLAKPKPVCCKISLNSDVLYCTGKRTLKLMCGIVAYVGHRNAQDVIIKGLKDLNTGDMIVQALLY